MSTLDLIRQLRERTKAGVSDCRQALDDCNGDIKEAEKWLREKGIRSAEKRAGRETKQGRVEAYSHGEGKIVAVIELQCETDFVARTDEFKNLAHELAMQVAAMNPKNIDELLAQPWIRDGNRNIEAMVKELSGKTGENIKLARFVRYELGE